MNLSLRIGKLFFKSLKSGYFILYQTSFIPRVTGVALPKKLQKLIKKIVPKFYLSYALTYM